MTLKLLLIAWKVVWINVSCLRVHLSSKHPRRVYHVSGSSQDTEDTIRSKTQWSGSYCFCLSSISSPCSVTVPHPLPLEELTFLPLMWLWWGHQSCVYFAALSALPWPEQEFLWLGSTASLVSVLPKCSGQTSLLSPSHPVSYQCFFFHLTHLFRVEFCGLQPNSLTYSSCVLKACHGQVG